ncbi:hypothetical protein J6590_030500 [Homalodisca vitripennis]|nr:hypothetical protein J6590_030500 [Homalodisca vitripennis]
MTLSLQGIICQKGSKDTGPLSLGSTLSCHCQQLLCPVIHDPVETFPLHNRAILQSLGYKNNRFAICHDTCSRNSRIHSVNVSLAEFCIIQHDKSQLHIHILYLQLSRNTLSSGHVAQWMESIPPVRSPSPIIISIHCFPYSAFSVFDLERMIFKTRFSFCIQRNKPGHSKLAGHEVIAGVFRQIGADLQFIELQRHSRYGSSGQEVSVPVRCVPTGGISCPKWMQGRKRERGDRDCNRNRNRGGQADVPGRPVWIDLSQTDTVYCLLLGLPNTNLWGPDGLRSPVVTTDRTAYVLVVGHIHIRHVKHTVSCYRTSIYTRNFGLGPTVYGEVSILVLPETYACLS